MALQIGDRVKLKTFSEDDHKACDVGRIYNAKWCIRLDDGSEAQAYNFELIPQPGDISAHLELELSLNKAVWCMTALDDLFAAYFRRNSDETNASAMLFQDAFELISNARDALGDLPKRSPDADVPYPPKRLPVMVMGSSIGTCESSNKGHTNEITFVDFKPAPGIKIPAGDLLVDYDGGVLECDCDDETIFDGNIVAAIALVAEDEPMAIVEAAE